MFDLDDSNTTLAEKSAVALILWAIVIQTFATWQVYTGKVEMSAAMAATYGTTTSVFTAVIAYIQKRMADLDEKIRTRST